MPKSVPPLSVQITGSYPPRVCGIADYTSLLTQSLTRAGAGVEVWTRHGETSREGVVDEGVVDCVERWDREGLRALGRLLRQRRPPLVHLQYEPGIYDSNPAITLLPFLTRRLRIPLVTTFHSLDGSSRWGKAHRLALAPLLLGSRDLIVCSQRQWNGLKRLQGRGRTVSLIPVGSSVDVVGEANAFTPVESVDADAPFRLTYFGFVWQGRNIETLLRALAAVVTVRRDAVLEVVGGIRDEAYLREILALAEQLGVAGRVTFTGDLPSAQISQALHRADVALLPFATGVSTGRTTLMAALAHHSPVVTYSVDQNLSPLFRHRENMMIAPQGNETEFIAHVRELADDPGLRRHLAAGAAELAGSFSWSRIAEQVLSLPSYRKIYSDGLYFPRV